MVTKPSVVPIVLGAIALAAAGVSMIVALVFFLASSEQSAQQPKNQAAIDLLWKSEGIMMPGTGDILLSEPGVYQVYLETDDADTFRAGEVDFEVMDFTAHSVLVDRIPLQGFHRGRRELLPKGSFFVSEPGVYRVNSSKPYRGPDDARIKVGPAAGLADGRFASISRGLAIMASLFALVLLTTAILLFWRYGKRRRVFNLARRSASEMI
jgi:hypothetical protein